MSAIIQDKESIVKQICLELEEILNEKSLLLDNKKQSTFTKVKYLYGFTGQYPFKCEINNIKIDDLLSIESLNKLEPADRNKLIDSLMRSLLARLFATEFKAEELTLDLKNYSFHYNVLVLLPFEWN